MRYTWRYQTSPQKFFLMLRLGIRFLWVFRFLVFFLKAVIYVLSGCKLQKSGSASRNTTASQGGETFALQIPQIPVPWGDNIQMGTQQPSFFRGYKPFFWGGLKPFMAFVGPLGGPQRFCGNFDMSKGFGPKVSFD